MAIYASVQKIYNWYKRYKVGAGDLTAFQSGMLNLGRGQAEGLTGASVLKGLEVSLTSGMGISIAAGLATGSDGYLHVSLSAITGTLPAPTTNPIRSLVVLRKNLVSGDNIPQPTSPSTMVPLTQTQGTQLVVIAGVEAASPVFPTGSLQQGDCVLFGYRAIVGQTTLLASDLDFNVRDIPGKNSNLQQNAGRYDDRLRVYRYSANQIGIKPSQLPFSYTKAYSYIKSNSPSAFPRDASGNYNGAAGDGIYNMQTGSNTGSDTNWTGTIAQMNTLTAGQCINGTVVCSDTDRITVVYGTAGTRTQCLAGLQNLNSSGAGSVNIPTTGKILAFVMVQCNVSSQVNEIDVFDARGATSIPVITVSSTVVATPGTASNTNVLTSVSTTGLYPGQQVTGLGITLPTFVRLISSGNVLLTRAVATTGTGTYTYSHNYAFGTTPQAQLDQLDAALAAASLTIPVDPTVTPYVDPTTAMNALFAVKTTTIGNPQQTFTLPAPSAFARFCVTDYIGNAFQNPIILQRNGSEKINGVAANYNLYGEYGSWVVTSDGTDWYVHAMQRDDRVKYRRLIVAYAAGSPFANATISVPKTTNRILGIQGVAYMSNGAARLVTIGNFTGNTAAGYIDPVLTGTNSTTIYANSGQTTSLYGYDLLVAYTDG